MKIGDFLVNGEGLFQIMRIDNTYIDVKSCSHPNFEYIHTNLDTKFYIFNPAPSDKVANYIARKLSK